MGVDNGDGTFSTRDPVTGQIVQVTDDKTEDEQLTSWQEKLNNPDREKTTDN